MTALRNSLIALFLLSLLAVSWAQTSPAQAEPLACPPDCKYSLPIIKKAPLTWIIDHNNIDITQIPDVWLTAARALTIHYGQTSHGSQILSGLEYLKSHVDGVKYNYAISLGVTPPTLPAGTNLLKIYTGNNYSGNTYITPDMYWDGSSGITKTNSTAATGLFGFSMWSWCGQADTSDSSYINRYLLQMSAFEAAHPGMRFILMTGHNVGNPGTNLLARNQQIRDYALANNMILFDFADIETYDPDGGFHNPATTNYSDGSCPWCDSWCSSHASYCTNIPLDFSECAHTDGLFCKMKAQAFWWMMARLAGWNGIP